MKRAITLMCAFIICGRADAQAQLQTIAVQDVVLHLGMTQPELAKTSHLVMSKTGSISNTPES